MFERIVAYILNKYICKYVKDLDPEHLNVGIFSGTVQLTDLELKAEALSQFDLPIEVKAGQIGKVSIDIPWTTLSSDPVLIHLEDILVVASPIDCSTEEYDSEHERLLLRAHKLEKLLQINSKKLDGKSQDESLLSKVTTEPRSIFSNLLAKIVNNVQVSLQSVHIRFEDTVTLSLVNGRAITAGIAFQSLTAITTNHKWKPAQIDGNSSNIFKLVKLETFYVYWNGDTSLEKLVQNYIPKEKSLNGLTQSDFSDGRDIGASCKYEWADMMKKAIYDCSMCGDEFDFVLKPIIAKLKLIINKSNEHRVPKLLVDCVLQDASLSLSLCQYRSLLHVIDSFEWISINRRYWKYKPHGVSLQLMAIRPIQGREKAKLWWQYAIKSVLEEFVRPYSWKRISQHRSAFKKCVGMYCNLISNPANSELKVDLQKAEDALDVTNLLLAQQCAKMEFIKKHPDKSPNAFDEVIDIVEGGQLSSSKLLTAEEREKIYDLLEDKRDQIANTSHVMVTVSDMSSDNEAESNGQYIGHKINFTLANCTLNLVVDGKDIFVFTFNTLMVSFETKPIASGYKLSVRCESFSIEAMTQAVSPDLGDIMVPIVTGDSSTTTTPKGSPKSPYIFALDIESNAPESTSQYDANLCIESIEIIYSIVNINELIAFFRTPPHTKSSQAIEHLMRNMVTAATESVHELIEYNQKGLINLTIDCKSPYVVIPEDGKLGTGQRGPAGRLLIIDLGRLMVKSDTDDKELAGDSFDNRAGSITRLNCSLTGVQVLFTDESTEEDEWRCALKVAESDLHALKRMNVHFIWTMVKFRSENDELSSSPKHQLSASIPSLKLNISDRRLRLLIEFIRKTPLPMLQPPSLLSSYASSFELPHLSHEEPVSEHTYRINLVECQCEPSIEELRSIRLKFTSSTEPSGLSISSEGGTTLSNESKGDESQYAQNNTSSFIPGSINVLIKIGIDDIGIDCCQSNQSAIHCERPYLMANANNFALEISLYHSKEIKSKIGDGKDKSQNQILVSMKGSLTRLHVVDKQFTCSSGKYLELLHSDQLRLSISYRKTLAENWIEIKLGHVNTTIHKESLVSLFKFSSQLIGGFKRPSRSPTPTIARMTPQPDLEKGDQSGPFLTQLRSISEGTGRSESHHGTNPTDNQGLKIVLHAEAIRAILCDTQTDLALVSLDGVECEFDTKPSQNLIDPQRERAFYSRPFIVSLSLTRLEIHNLSESEENSLYSKILMPSPSVSSTPNQPQIREGGKLFELHLEHASDSYSVKIKLEKMQLVLIYSFIKEMQMFFVPLFKSTYADPLKRTVKRTISETIKVLSFSKTSSSIQNLHSEKMQSEVPTTSSRLGLNLDIKAPIILIPFKMSSTELFVLNCGQFLVDNFTQKPLFEEKDDEIQIMINEWLVKLNSASLHRGIIRPDGGHEILFDLIGSSSISFILHQAVLNTGQKLIFYEKPYDALELEIEGSIDKLAVSLQQSDIRLFIQVYNENLKKILIRPKLKRYSTASTLSTPDISSATSSDHDGETSQKHKKSSTATLSREPTITDENISSDEIHNRDHATKTQSFFIRDRQEEVNKKKRKQMKFKLGTMNLDLLADEINQVRADGDHPLGPICSVHLDDVTICYELFSNSSYSINLDINDAAVEDVINGQQIINRNQEIARASDQPSSAQSPHFLNLQYVKTLHDQGSIDFNIDQTHIGFNFGFLSLMTKYLSGSLSPVLPLKFEIRDLSSLAVGLLRVGDQASLGTNDAASKPHHPRKHRKNRREKASHQNTTSSSDEEPPAHPHPPHHSHSPFRQVHSPRPNMSE